MLETEETRTAIVLLALACLYFAPAIIATIRQRPNVGTITLVNLLGGWTVIGWVLPLVWSLSGDRPAAAPLDAPRPSSWAPPIDYVPTSRSEAGAALTDPAPARRPRFADAEAEATAAYRASQPPGGGAWS